MLKSIKILYNNFISICPYLRKIMEIRFLAVCIFLFIVILYQTHSDAETQFEVFPIVFNFIIERIPMYVAFFLLGSYFFFLRILFYLFKPGFFLLEPLLEEVGSGPLLMDGRGRELVPGGPGRNAPGSPVRDLLGGGIGEPIRVRTPSPSSIRGPNPEALPSGSPSDGSTSSDNPSSADGGRPLESKQGSVSGSPPPPPHPREGTGEDNPRNRGTSSRCGKRKWSLLVGIGTSSSPGPSSNGPSVRVNLMPTDPSAPGSSNAPWVRVNLRVEDPTGPGPSNPSPIINQQRSPAVDPQALAREHLFIENPEILQDFLKAQELFPSEELEKQIGQYFGPNSNPEVTAHYFSLERAPEPGESFPGGTGNLDFETFLREEREVSYQRLFGNLNFRRNFANVHFSANLFLRNNETRAQLNFSETLDGLAFWSRENDANRSYHILERENLSNALREDIIYHIIQWRQRRDLYNYGMEATTIQNSPAWRQVDALLEIAQQQNGEITRRDVLRGMQYWMVANPTRSTATLLRVPVEQYGSLFDSMISFIIDHRIKDESPNPDPFAGFLEKLIG